jgi:hypothetical protein
MLLSAFYGARLVYFDGMSIEAALFVGQEVTSSHLCLHLFHRRWMTFKACITVNYKLLLAVDCHFKITQEDKKNPCTKLTCLGFNLSCWRGFFLFPSLVYGNYNIMIERIPTTLSLHELGSQTPKLTHTIL